MLWSKISTVCYNWWTFWWNFKVDFLLCDTLIDKPVARIHLSVSSSLSSFSGWRCFIQIATYVTRSGSVATYYYCESSVGLANTNETPQLESPPTTSKMMIVSVMIHYLDTLNNYYVQDQIKKLEKKYSINACRYILWPTLTTMQVDAPHGTVYTHALHIQW